MIIENGVAEINHILWKEMMEKRERGGVGINRQFGNVLTPYQLRDDSSPHHSHFNAPSRYY